MKNNKNFRIFLLMILTTASEKVVSVPIVDIKGEEMLFNLDKLFKRIDQIVERLWQDTEKDKINMMKREKDENEGHIPDKNQIETENPPFVIKEGLVPKNQIEDYNQQIHNQPQNQIETEEGKAVSKDLLQPKTSRKWIRRTGKPTEAEIKKRQMKIQSNQSKAMTDAAKARKEAERKAKAEQRRILKEARAKHLKEQKEKKITEKSKARADAAKATQLRKEAEKKAKAEQRRILKEASDVRKKEARAKHLKEQKEKALKKRH